MAGSHVSYVHYRIQNVDFSTYLQLYDIGDPRVVLRLPKQDLVQEWKFIPVDGSNQSFKILNAATENSTIPLYLTATSSAQSTNNIPNISCATEAESQVWTTKLFTIKDSSIFSITCPSGQNSICFLTVDENGKLTYVEDTLLSPNQLNLKQDRQWRILEVSAPLKSNTYMIRNLNGTALHMKPGGEVSTEKVHKGAHEKWIVQVYGNGKCTIKNFKEDLYLGWEEQTTDVFKAEKSTEEKIWIVRDVGQYSYMITMNHVKSGQNSTPLLLSWQDDHQVILKSSTVAHNRVWIFEPVNITDTDIAKVPAPIIFVPTRYKEINPNVGYSFKNVATGYFLGSAVPETSVQVSLSSYTWYIRYTGMTGEFHLARDPDGRCCAQNRVFNLWAYDSKLNPPGTWMLDRIDDIDGFSYHILLTSATDYALTHVGINLPIFSLALHQPGNRNQLWKIL